jgi:hypothetical protein
MPKYYQLVEVPSFGKKPNIDDWRTFKPGGEY